jgi:hypothetical protein
MKRRHLFAAVGAAAIVPASAVAAPSPLAAMNEKIDRDLVEAIEMHVNDVTLAAECEPAGIYGGRFGALYRENFISAFEGRLRRVAWMDAETSAAINRIYEGDDHA